MSWITSQERGVWIAELEYKDVVVRAEIRKDTRGAKLWLVHWMTLAWTARTASTAPLEFLPCLGSFEGALASALQRSLFQLGALMQEAAMEVARDD